MENESEYRNVQIVLKQTVDAGARSADNNNFIIIIILHTRNYGGP